MEQKRVLALISGGKDSTFSILKCVEWGYKIVGLATIHPGSSEKVETVELDSHLFQTVGVGLTRAFAKAMNLPLFVGFLGKRKSVLINMEYDNTDENDEVEALYDLLHGIQKGSIKPINRDDSTNQGDTIHFDFVCSGVIASEYQRIRVEHVCRRLNLKSIAPLYRKSQIKILEEMINTPNFKAIVVKVATIGLNSSHLGKSLEEMSPILHSAHDKYGVNVCGEGGEFETITVQFPLFRNRSPYGSLKLVDPQVVNHSNDGCGSAVSYLKFGDVKCEIGSSINHCIDGERNEWMFITNFKFLQNFDDLTKMLREKNFCLSDVICMYVSLNSPTDACYEDVNSIFKTEYKKFNSKYAVRVCVGLSSPHDGHLANIDVIAYKPCVVTKRDDSTEIISQLKSLHVSSVSDWVPANIGPYGQAVSLFDNDLLFIAGQIGLNPCTMDFQTKDTMEQLYVSLSHCDSVLKYFDSEGCLACCSTVFICFTTDFNIFADLYKLYMTYVNKKFVATCYTCAKSGIKNAFDMIVIPVEWLPRDAYVECQVLASSCREGVRFDGLFDHVEVNKLCSVVKGGIFHHFNEEKVEECYFSTVVEKLKHFRGGMVTLYLSAQIRNLPNCCQHYLDAMKNISVKVIFASGEIKFVSNFHKDEKVVVDYNAYIYGILIR